MLCLYLHYISFGGKHRWMARNSIWRHCLCHKNLAHIGHGGFRAALRTGVRSDEQKKIIIMKKPTIKSRIISNVWRIGWNSNVSTALRTYLAILWGNIHGTNDRRQCTRHRLLLLLHKSDNRMPFSAAVRETILSSKLWNQFKNNLLVKYVNKESGGFTLCAERKIQKRKKNKNKTWMSNRNIGQIKKL